MRKKKDSVDWLYAPGRMRYREKCLSILLDKFGGELNEDGTPVHSNESLYACAHDWVSQGIQTTQGLIESYLKDYND